MSNEHADTNLNLEILAEEASEVIEAFSRIVRRKSKIARFGLTDHHPENRTLNNEALEEEIGPFFFCHGRGPGESGDTLGKLCLRRNQKEKGNLGSVLPAYRLYSYCPPDVSLL